MPRENHDPPSSFLARHSRLLSLVGLALVFVTFVVKDAIREQLKDSLDSINAAESLYLIREDSATVRELVMAEDERLDAISKSVNPPKEAEKPSQLNKILDQTFERERAYTLLESSLENTSRLVDTLPNPKPASAKLIALRGQLEEIRKLDKQAQSVGNDYFKNLTIDDVLRNDPGKEQETLRKEAELEEPLVSRTFALLIATSQYMNDVIEEARRQHKSQEHLYAVFTWLSYFLYAAGWVLNVVGQASAVRVE